MRENNLFLTDAPETKAEFLQIINQTAAAIAASFTDDTAYSGPVPQQLQKDITVPDMLPARGLGFETILKQLQNVILPNFVRTSSSDYMAHLHSPALLETIAAELVISVFNQSMDSWDQSPVATEVEVAVVRFLCELYGYNPNLADGVFTSGGSQSNMTGILLARDWFCNTKLNHDVKKYGLPADYRKFRLYTSEISHFSMEKSAHILGLGYESVVKVPVDAAQKMDTKALRNLIETDIAAGNLPFCVVATVGTTDFGSIDPLTDIADLCAQHNLWLHGDAAYGSGVILSKDYAPRINGLARCNSITVDFHKMFLLPISCSAVLIQDKHQFDTLTIHADYLNREEDEEDGYTNLVGKSMQTTRRFDALKVWTSFQVRGRNGWNDIISTCIQNAEYLYTQLLTHPEFSVVTRPEISSVVFRLVCAGTTPETADEINKQVRRALIHEHGIVIGQTVCNNRVQLKFTLLNPLITHAKLDTLLATIMTLAKNVPASK